MGLFRRSKRADEKQNESQSQENILLRAMLGQETVDRAAALSIPSISGYVDMICNAFARVPIKLYKIELNDGKKTSIEIDDDRVRIINADTNDTLDAFQFKKAMCEDYLLGKGGYAYIKKRGNTFDGLFYVPESKISIQKNQDPIFKNFDIVVGGNQRFKEFEFIKLLRNSKDGASGKGLVTEIERSLRTAVKRLAYEYDLTATGGSRKGFLKSKNRIDDKAMDALKAAWESYYAGNSNTVILNDGIEFQEASNTSEQNEINEKSKTFNEEMRTIFHIGNNYEDFIRDAVLPIVNAFVKALNRDFLLETEKKEFAFAPDVNELLKGSLRERYEAYRIAIESGFKTRNEIRYLENDNQLPGLDVVNLSLGSVLLDAKTGEIYTPNTNQKTKMGEKEPENQGNDTKGTKSAQGQQKTGSSQGGNENGEPEKKGLKGLKKGQMEGGADK